MVERVENNVYKVTVGGNKPFIINLETNECIGRSGKVLKHMPTNYGLNVLNIGEYQFVNACLNKIFEKVYYLDLNSIMFYEKLMNISANLDNTVQFNLYGANSANDISWANENWKQFVKVYKALSEDNDKLVIDMHDIRDYIAEETILKEKKFSREDLKLLKRKLSISDINTWSKHELNLMLNVIRPDTHDATVALFGEYASTNIVRDTVRRAKQYGVEIPTGTNWVTTLYNVRNACDNIERERENARHEKENALVRILQTSIPLEYENDNFKIIVPTEYSEFSNEGAKLHNCLGGHEWNNYISTAKRRVAFVRRKDNLEKPYIALDIDVFDNRIVQYLTYSNNDVRESDAKAFKIEYQNYLNSLKVVSTSAIYTKLHETSESAVE